MAFNFEIKIVVAVAHMCFVKKYLKNTHLLCLS